MSPEELESECLLGRRRMMYWPDLGAASELSFDRGAKAVAAECSLMLGMGVISLMSFDERTLSKSARGVL
jgi:hypothetical protein